jgi:radical SAM protein with 4Fe4S-binding SPASM domain
MHPQLRSPVKLTLCVTNTCNLNCIHCYSDCTREPDPRELTTNEWKRFIDHLVENKVMQAFIEGGEPFFRSDFLEILGHCSRRMNLIVRTFANQITEELAERLKELKVGLVCVDLLGARPETHDAHVGTPGSFELGIRGVRNLVAAGVPIYTLMILTRRNVSQLQEYVDLAHALGAIKAAALRLYPLGRSKRRWHELSLPLHEMMQALQSVKVPEGFRFIHSWHPNDGNSCYQMSCVSPFGKSIGCPYLREYIDLGDVREKSFVDTWHDPLWKELRSGNVSDSCSECHDTQGSVGGCRATAFAFHGRWDAPDPYCAQMNHGIDLQRLPEQLFWKKPWVEK